MRDHDSAGNQVATLEQFVELTTHVPPELQRLLSTIRDLDEKTQSLASEVRQDVDICLDLVPQSSWKSPNGEQYKEVAERRASIEERQRKLVQMAEEKVQLAVQGYELLDTMLGHLKEHMKEFEDDEDDIASTVSKSRLEGPMGGLLSSVSLPNPSSGHPPLPRRPSGAQVGRKNSEKKLTAEKKRERDAGAQEAAPSPKSRRTTSASLQSLASGIEGFFAANPDKAKSAVAAAAAAVAGAAAAAPAAMAAAASAGAAAVQQAASQAQAVAAAAAGAAVSAASAAASPLGTAPLAAAAAGGAAAQPKGGTGGSTPGRSAIQGLRPDSANLQAPGRLLTHADISQELRGRHAELFWPDDKTWYVITINEVNPVAKTARIMYTTGETEELDLNEIVRDAHMSLITAKST